MDVQFLKYNRKKKTENYDRLIIIERFCCLIDDISCTSSLHGIMQASLE